MVTDKTATETQESFEAAILVRPEENTQALQKAAETWPERFIRSIVRNIAENFAEGFRMQEGKESGVILFKFDQATHTKILRKIG